MNVLITTWQAGGASQPAIGLGRLLVERGHGVRVLAPAGYAERVRAAGCRQRSFPPSAEFDATRGRAMEDQVGFLREIFSGQTLPDAVVAELAAEPADVIVVDYLLRSVVSLAERSPLPFVPLVHTTYRFHRPTPSDAVTAGIVERAPLVLVPIPRELDDWPNPPPQVVHTGPIVEEAAPGEWASPWPESDTRPLVVVSMGTTYMHHEHVLGRVARAAANLDVRVLVLTGYEVDTVEVAAVDGVHVAAYVPHTAVLPSASLVVTHAGVGTLVASLAAGVPLLCLPLGRDQQLNARRVEELGVGVVLSHDASVTTITDTIRDVLSFAVFHDAAAHIAQQITHYNGGAEAVTALEQLVTNSRS
jgi:UDP:flavonoid glycosyltransferase YjiC (YdhE family)